MKKKFTEIVAMNVISIVDGDSLICTLPDDTKTTYKVRLSKIDAPELNQPSGWKSQYELKRYLAESNFKIYINPKEIYKENIIADIYVTDPIINNSNFQESINNKMVESGNAWFFKESVNSSDYEAQLLIKSEKSAARQSKGLWKTGDYKMPIEPYKWKKEKMEMSIFQLIKEKMKERSYSKKYNLNYSFFSEKQNERNFTQIHEEIKKEIIEDISINDDEFDLFSEIDHKEDKLNYNNKLEDSSISIKFEPVDNFIGEKLNYKNLDSDREIEKKERKNRNEEQRTAKTIEEIKNRQDVKIQKMMDGVDKLLEEDKNNNIVLGVDDFDFDFEQTTIIQETKEKTIKTDELNINDLNIDLFEFQDKTMKNDFTDTMNYNNNNQFQEVQPVYNDYDNIKLDEIPPQYNDYDNIKLDEIPPQYNDYDNIRLDEIPPQYNDYDNIRLEEIPPQYNDYDNIRLEEIPPQYNDSQYTKNNNKNKLSQKVSISGMKRKNRQ